MKKEICFTNWGNFQLWLGEVGQQRVKLDGRAAREPFGGKTCDQYQYRHYCNIGSCFGWLWQIWDKQCGIFQISYKVFRDFSFYLLSHILVQVQNERFHHQRHSPSSLQKLFSLYFSRCNFSSSWEVARKGSLLIPAPISSPLTQLQPNHPQTDFREKADTSSESENFLESHNQRDLKFSPEKIVWSGYRFSELEEGIISEGWFVNANIYWHLEKIWRGSTLNTE